MNSHLMASCFRNVCAKNRQNPLILFKVTIDNGGVPFVRHSVYAKYFEYWLKVDKSYCMKRWCSFFMAYSVLRIGRSIADESNLRISHLRCIIFFCLFFYLCVFVRYCYYVVNSCGRWSLQINFYTKVRRNSFISSRS